MPNTMSERAASLEAGRGLLCRVFKEAKEHSLTLVRSWRLPERMWQTLEVHAFS